MKKKLTPAHEKFIGSSLSRQLISGEFDSTMYSTIKDYECIKGLDACSVQDFLKGSENTIYMFYDMQKMIDIYEAEHGELNYLLMKDKTTIAGLTYLKAYRKDDLEKVVSYFKASGRNILFKEYISLAYFVEAIKGDEPAERVRIKWYKRFEKVGVISEKKNRKAMLYDLSNFQLRKKTDLANTNKRTKAYLYNVQDIIKIKNYYDQIEAQNKSKKTVDEAQ